MALGMIPRAAHGQLKVPKPVSRGAEEEKGVERVRRREKRGGRGGAERGEEKGEQRGKEKGGGRGQHMHHEALLQIRPPQPHL